MIFVFRILLMLIQNQAKRKATLAYLRALQGSRRVLMVVLGGFIMVQCMILAAFGALVTGLMLLDYDQVTKLEILFGVFLGIFALPAIFLMVLFSQKLWYRISGAEKLVEELRPK